MAAMQLVDYDEWVEGEGHDVAETHDEHGELIFGEARIALEYRERFTQRFAWPWLAFDRRDAREDRQGQQREQRTSREDHAEADVERAEQRRHQQRGQRRRSAAANAHPAPQLAAELPWIDVFHDRGVEG